MAEEFEDQVRESQLHAGQVAGMAINESRS
jgi:hypothetical protein